MGQNDKILSVFGYFGILFLIPLFAGNNSQFTRYHANQGLLLFILDIILYVIALIIGGVIILVSGFQAVLAVPLIMSLVSLVVMIFAIIGIVHAAQGEMKPLPVIGGFTLIKY